MMALVTLFLIALINVAFVAGHNLLKWNDLKSAGWQYAYGTAISHDGKYQTFVSSSIFRSNDFGKKFSPYRNSQAHCWFEGVAVSDSGKYQTAVCSDSTYNGFSSPSTIMTSNNNGGSWFVNSILRNWGGVAISSTGQYQTAVVYDDTDGIYHSINFGSTWSSRGVARYYESCSMSGSGKYQAATGDDDYMLISSDFGLTWVQASTGYDEFNVVSMSRSGQVIIGGADDYLQISYDFGATWNQPEPVADDTAVSVAVSGNGNFFLVGTDEYLVRTANANSVVKSDGPVFKNIMKGNQEFWRTICVSGDGKYISAANDVYIYVSIDSGKTWADYNFSPHYYYDSAMSKNGKYQIFAANDGYVTISSDYGSNWSNYYLGYSDSTYVAMTSDGSGILACVYTNDCYASNNFGAGFNSIGSGNIEYGHVALSATGEYALVAVSGYGLALSNQYGHTEYYLERARFTYYSSYAFWWAVAMSANGKYQYAADYNGYTSVVSSNFGQTWAETNSPVQYWQSISMSSSGQFLFAVAYGGYAWFSKNHGKDWQVFPNSGYKWWSCVKIAADTNVAVFSAFDNWDSLEYLYSVKYPTA